MTTTRTGATTDTGKALAALQWIYHRLGETGADWRLQAHSLYAIRCLADYVSDGDADLHYRAFATAALEDGETIPRGYPVQLAPGRLP